MLWQRWATRRSTHCHRARSVRGSPSESGKTCFYLLKQKKVKNRKKPPCSLASFHAFVCVKAHARVCISACLTLTITARRVSDSIRQQQILNQQVFVEGASVCSALASDRFGYIRRSGIHSLTTGPIEWLHLNHL